MSHSALRSRFQASIARGISTLTDVRYEPGSDTVVAIFSLLALWGIYYFQSTNESVEALLLFLLVGNLALTVLMPLYYVCYLRGEPLSAVGLTTDGWKPAVFASTVVAVVLSPGLIFADESAVTLVPHVLTVGLMLWEPFFVHGWLQIRFERAFGTGPALVLTAASFALFHVGAVELTGLLALLLFGLVHAILFRAFERNILVLWPILWAVGSSQGTLDTIVFGWEESATYFVILLVAAVAIHGTRRSVGVNKS